MRFSLHILVMLSMAFAANAAEQVALTGVNLAGAEFTPGQIPGTYDTHYTYPTIANANYYRQKGMNCFRLPFLWERLQPTMDAPFVNQEWNRLDSLVTSITESGATVILDPHDYARRGGSVIGSSQVSNSQFANLWYRLALAYKSNPRVVFGLMNEPNTMSTEQWLAAANAGIAAIRSASAGNLILVPGNAWTGAHSWSQNWYGTANATVMLGVVDPLNNYAYELHQYVDSDYSGTNTGSVKDNNANVGAQALANVTQWLIANNKRGFLGEFATPSSTLGQAAATAMVQHMHDNAQVWIGWTWWAGGPWWGDYGFSLEPSGNNDKPMLNTLTPFFARPVSNLAPVITRSATAQSGNLLPP